MIIDIGSCKIEASDLLQRSLGDECLERIEIERAILEWNMFERLAAIGCSKISEEIPSEDAFLEFNRSDQFEWRWKDSWKLDNIFLLVFVLDFVIEFVVVIVTARMATIAAAVAHIVGKWLIAVMSSTCVRSATAMTALRCTAMMMMVVVVVVVVVLIRVNSLDRSVVQRPAVGETTQLLKFEW